MPNETQNLGESEITQYGFLLLKDAELNQTVVSAKLLHRGLANGGISHYSRWVKKNILENDLYDENVNYCISRHSGDYSGRDQMATDYALTVY